jgi:hypothetical protein
MADQRATRAARIVMRRFSSSSEAGRHNLEFWLQIAFALHGRPRATVDLDVWVEPNPANAAKVMQALASFGAPLTGNKRATGRPKDLGDIEGM